MDMNELSHLKTFYTVTKTGQLRTHVAEEEGVLSPPYINSFASKKDALEAFKKFKEGN